MIKLFAHWLTPGSTAICFGNATRATCPHFQANWTPLYELIEVAGGKILARFALVWIDWFNEEGAFTPVEVWVSLSAKEHRPGDPIALVGTALLSGMTLYVDFLNGTLRIEPSA
jgi:hypothetical protein